MSSQKVESPVKITEDIFLVSAPITSGPAKMVQSHAYLLISYGKGILFDGGSYVNRDKTIENISKIIDPKNITHIVISHPDVDTIGCVDELIEINPDVNIITSEKNLPLLATFLPDGIRLTVLTESEHIIKFGDLDIVFIATPYVHTPGSFIAYIPDKKSLISFDLFSGILSETDKNENIFIDDENYLKKVEDFMYIYFPNKFEVSNILDRISKLDIDLILPHHGKIIVKNFVQRVISLYYKHYFKIQQSSNDVVLTKTISSIIKKSLERFDLDHLQQSDGKVKNLVAIIEESLREILPESEALLIARYSSKLFILDKNNFVVKHISTHNDIITYYTLMSRQRELIKEEIKLFDRLLKPCIFTVPIYDFHHETFVVVFENISEGIDKEKLFLAEKILKEPEILLLVRSEVGNLVHLKEKEELMEQATKCKLTGLFNRNYFETEIKKEFIKARRYRYPISVIMIDIDNFKDINDRYGHLIGDLVLKVTGDIITKNIRSIDIPVRYGGEEFLIVLPHTSAIRAERVAERIREKIEKTKINTPYGPISVTASFGVTEFDGNESIERLLDRVDMALYESKRKGKNKVTVY